MKKIVKRLLIVVLSLVAIFILGVVVFTGRQVFNGLTNAVSREETIENGAAYKGEVNELRKSYNVESVNLDVKNNNYPIPAMLVSNAENNNVVVMVHGMGGTKETLAPLMGAFLELGYNVLAYDQRNSGANLNDYNTFGILESYDALAAVDYASKLVDDGNLILWGESNGAITAMIAASRDSSNIDYLILDSPLVDGNTLFDKVINEVESKEGIPADFMKSAGEWYTHSALGFNYSDMDARNWVSNVNIPVLISYDKDDKLISLDEVEDLFARLGSRNKDMVITEGYGHGSYPFKAEEDYKGHIKDFLESNRGS